jgi:Zn-dependent protease with chaperone function
MALYLIGLILFLTVLAAFEDRKYGDALITFLVALVSIIILAFGIVLLTESNSLGEAVAAIVVIIVSGAALLMSFLKRYFEETAWIVGAGLVVATIAFIGL